MDIVMSITHQLVCLVLDKHTKSEKLHIYRFELFLYEQKYDMWYVVCGSMEWYMWPTNK